MAETTGAHRDVTDEIAPPRNRRAKRTRASEPFYLQLVLSISVGLFATIGTTSIASFHIDVPPMWTGGVSDVLSDIDPLDFGPNEVGFKFGLFLVIGIIVAWAGVHPVQLVQTRIRTVVLMVFVLGLVTSPWSAHVWFSFSTLVLAWISWLLTLAFIDRYGWDRFADVLAATGGIYVWMSLLTQVWGLPGQRIYAGGLTSSRLVGMSVHPNTLAPIAAVTILLLISIGTRRASAHLTIAAAALVLVLTESRVMLVALVVARVVLAIGSRRALIVLITLFSSLAVSVAVDDSTAGVLESISRDPESADAVTLSGRIKVWDDGLERRSESTLLGAGWASSPAQYATDGVAGTSLNPAHPHNGWIAVYQELGLIGLAASVAIVIGLIGRSTDPRRRALLAFVLIANLGESLMWSAQRSLVDFVFMGIIASMSATSGRHWPETTFKPSERMITL